MARQNSQRQGETLFNQSEKVNAELFALTYGSLVVKLIREHETIAEVNRQLELMGFNIGQRLIDDFLSKTDVTCENTREIAESIARIGFKMYLGVTCELANWGPDDKAFSIILNENPLTEFVDLSEDFQNLHYLNLLCGVLRGVLEMIRYRTNCYIVKDSLKGDEYNEIRVEILEIIHDEYVPDDS